jgi:hypothetical protein
MPTARSLRSIVAFAFAAVGAGHQLAAQSSSDLAAFNALIVSPAGALPPTADDDGRPLPDRAALFVSYGRWRYDINDAIHHNLGITLRDRLGTSTTSIAVTGAYLSSSCDCAGWWSAGVSLKSILWRSEPASDSPLRAGGHVAVEALAGGAQFSGVGHASAFSLASTLDVGGSVRVSNSSRLALSLLPGVGYGHLTSVDEVGGGTRPLLGAAVSWIFARGVSIDLGTRRIVIAGGPTQLGAGVSWHRR